MYTCSIPNKAEQNSGTFEATLKKMIVVMLLRKSTTLLEEDRRSTNTHREENEGTDGKPRNQRIFQGHHQYASVVRNNLK
jgi:hypothetical protein